MNWVKSRVLNRRVIAIAAAAAIVLVFGVTAAGAHNNVYISKATTRIAHCGDQYHESAVYAGGFIQENGVSGTEQFRIVFFLQDWDGTAWRNSSSTPVTSNVFANDARSLSWRPVEPGTNNEAFEIEATLANQDQYIRPKIQYDWLAVADNGTTTLLHRHTIVGTSYCFAGNIPPPAAPTR